MKHDFMKRLNRWLLYVFTPHPRHPGRAILAYIGGLVWTSILGNACYGGLHSLESHSKPPVVPFVVCIGLVALFLLWCKVAKLPASAPIIG